MKNFMGLMLLACASAQAADMIELQYRDQEPEGPSYQTRILVTDRYLRMDEGRDEGDFVLLDRKSGKVVNVVHGQKTIMTVYNHPLPKASPQPYRVEKKVTPIRDGTVRLQVLANGKLCSETVAAARLFPEAVRAMVEYKAALAYTQWATYRSTPVELRQDCDLAQHVWEAGYALSQGLPIEERDYAGRVRQYVSGNKQTLKPALFKLPQGYAMLALPDPAGGLTDSSSQP